jgi:hypothetical protein
MFDLNRHLKSEKVFIFGCAETFSNSDEKPYNLDNDYQWVGKCRKGNKTKGGIGVCVSRVCLYGDIFLHIFVEVPHQNYIITKIIEVGNIF